MRIDKAQVLDIMRSLGKDTGTAERDLPDHVDTDEHRDLLGKLGISGSELTEQFGSAEGGGVRGEEGSNFISDAIDEAHGGAGLPDGSGGGR